jgi:hypothetical protein
MLLWQASGNAQSSPRPPCGANPVPDYPALDQPATVISWSKSEFGRDWAPPACTAWASTGFATLVTTAARFHNSGTANGLLRHIGAVSQFTGIRYWSTTHKKWQTLIVDAHALSGPKTNQSRADFTPDEMIKGGVLYFEQTDNLSGNAVYQMRVAEASVDRLVVEIENVTPLRYHIMTVVDRGEMQSIYFLDRESDGVWRYYSILRIGKHASWLVAGNESSSINRAVAFYRYMVGIPTDQEPPAAR